MLAGLPEEYKLIGIESSETAITADSIKAKLLQDVKDSKAGKNTNSQMAFLAKRETKGPRCFRCNKYSHFANFCRSKPKRKNSKVSAQSVDEKKNSSKNEKAFFSFLSFSGINNGS